jgi:glutamyl-tRNA(Gln) amidotransferase subunit E
VGKDIQPGRRLGSEFADHAKKRGVAGIFHTDELLQYGITSRETEALLRFLNAEESDAVVILADENVKTCVEAIYAVMDRAKAATEGVPEETRRALSNGCSEYMRPLPGAARMYPETDVSPIAVPKALIDRIKAHLPERLDDRMHRYRQEYLLNEELARQIAWSENSQLFEKVMRLWGGLDGSPARDDVKDAATFVVRTLEGTIAELKRDNVPVDRLTRESILDVFRLVNSKTVSKEGVPEILRCLAECPSKGANDVAAELGFVMLSERELQAIVDDVVQSRLEFVKAKGVGAAGPLMGVVMKQVRGKADGKLVNEVLREKIASVLQ